MPYLCSREVLQNRFNEWLKENYSAETLLMVDLQLEAQKWVQEQGGMLAGSYGMLMTCGRCGQRTTVQPDGNFSMLDSDNECQVAGKPVVPVHEFNR